MGPVTALDQKSINFPRAPYTHRDFLHRQCVFRLYSNPPKPLTSKRLFASSTASAASLEAVGADLLGPTAGHGTAAHDDLILVAQALGFEEVDDFPSGWASWWTSGRRGR